MSRILRIEPTCFLKQTTKGLQRLIRIHLADGEMSERVRVSAFFSGSGHAVELNVTESGPSVLPLLIGEGDVPDVLHVRLFDGERFLEEKRADLAPARRWQVHVVQFSHHDPGYTDIPSRVVRQHNQWIDQAIDLVEETRDYPEDARFRLVLEQAWSVDGFFDRAPEMRKEKLAALLRSGHFEMSALFGNMTTEICGHESMIRCLYPSARLAAKYGFPLVSAQHNDITGMSVGLCRALSLSGIRYLNAGIPSYYGWGNEGLCSFWDERAVIGYEGPGAFLWVPPAGEAVRVWYANTGCGGEFRTALPGLEQWLRQVEDGGYPHSVVRYPVIGGDRDNSPYRCGFSDSIRRWNETWAFPRLVSSTEAMFHRAFSLGLAGELPRWQGELPGQDYPPGSASTAVVTAVNRNNHALFPAVEMLATLAAERPGFPCPAEELRDAEMDITWHDEHAWGFHFPCGPGMKASELEKAVRAWRASAVLQGLGDRAMSWLADQMEKKDGLLHLVVFNTTGIRRTAPVHMMLRAMEHAGSSMGWVSETADPQGVGYFKGFPLVGRGVDHPPPSLIDGRFDLLEHESDDEVPFWLHEIDSVMDTVPWAAERLGLGSGSKRLGLFEDPSGLRHELRFVARDVPAYGYRSYRIRPWLVEKQQAGGVVPQDATSDFTIENEFYAISVDPSCGTVLSLWDKLRRRELVDASAPHDFFSLIVRDADLSEHDMSCHAVRIVRHGSLASCIERDGRQLGHPAVRQTIRLVAGMPEVYLETRILKDATPLLEAHIAFPFAMDAPSFTYEGILSPLRPVGDFLPGAQSDTLAVQNWLRVEDEGVSILLCPQDAALVKLGRLWNGYVSPAHRCVFNTRGSHPPLCEEALDKGWVYSNVYDSNFGTNFSVTQTGDMLFRYVLTSGACGCAESDAASFGRNGVTPLMAVYSGTRGSLRLPAVGSMIRVSDARLQLLACKRAEDGRGLIMRLWNPSSETVCTEVAVDGASIGAIIRTDALERDVQEPCALVGGMPNVEVPPCGVVTFRLLSWESN